MISLQEELTDQAREVADVSEFEVGGMSFLTPAIAGAAMACSSVSVVSNSVRLRRFQRHAAAE